MKKNKRVNFKKATAGVLLCLGLTTISINASEEVNNKYPATLLVIETTKDTCICISSDGIEYEFEGNYNIGDCLSAIMVKSRTGFKSSDKITNVYKENWNIEYNFKPEVDETLEKVDKLLEDINSLKTKINEGLQFKNKFTWMK